MLIKKLNFKNFKRFVDLEINLERDGSELPKLVLLTGVNGSGKSSIFDGFEVVNKVVKSQTFSTPSESALVGLNYQVETNSADASYYSKNYANNRDNFRINIEFDLGYLVVNRIDGNTYDITSKLVANPNLFYGRSAFRYTPKLTKTTIGTSTDTSKDTDRPTSFIDTDTQRFDHDLDTFVVSQLRAFNAENPQVKSEFNRKFNEAFKNIFNLSENISLQYVDFETPADGKPFQFIFKKGAAVFNYDLLSAGEKMVFELLFNLYSRKSLYVNSIVFLDEIDLHLNTGLQKNLLKEITENWIPEGSQLWTASHSLGFIEYAREYEKGAIIDLDSLDFDEKQLLKPVENNNLSVYEIAVPIESIAVLFKDKRKIYCENKNEVFYNGLNIQDTVFLPEVDKNSVFLRVESSIDNDQLESGLIDRDFLSDEEVKKLKNKFNKLAILDYYCFENYIWHPDNIQELITDFNKEEYKSKLIGLKNNQADSILIKLADSRRHYAFFKKNLGIQDQNPDGIITLLRSDNFEDFYKVFSMKNRGDISGTNLSPKELAKTNWFKEKINAVISSRS